MRGLTKDEERRRLERLRQLAADGLTGWQLAERLQLSPRQVQRLTSEHRIQVAKVEQ